MTLNKGIDINQTNSKENAALSIAQQESFGTNNIYFSEYSKQGYKKTIKLETEINTNYREFDPENLHHL